MHINKYSYYLYSFIAYVLYMTCVLYALISGDMCVFIPTLRLPLFLVFFFFSHPLLSPLFDHIFECARARLRAGHATPTTNIRV